MLEKPGCMSQVPFGRTDVGHALNHIVLDEQRLADPFSQAPDLAVFSEEIEFGVD